MAVSGGLDSMTLLALLARERLAGEGVEVVAACFDHRTRGAESAADGRFVTAVAERWGARARTGAGDAPARDAERGEGPQAAARALRYAFLERVAREEEAWAVATAHQRDDRVETVLLRIARGTGIEGLGALRPVERRGVTLVVRPLLPFARADLAAWAAGTGVPFRDDPTNRAPGAPRTVVRERVLPGLRALNPRADEAVVRLAVQAAADAAWLAAAADERLAEATLEKDRAWVLEAATLVDLPDALLSRVLLAGWAWGAPPGAPPPSAEWVAGAVRFLRGGRGGVVECPGGGALRREGSAIAFEPAPAGGAESTDEEGR